MLDTEYNEAEVKELFKEEGRQEGIQQERNENLSQLVMYLMNNDPSLIQKDAENMAKAILGK